MTVPWRVWVLNAPGSIRALHELEDGGAGLGIRVRGRDDIDLARLFEGPPEGGLPRPIRVLDTSMSVIEGDHDRYVVEYGLQDLLLS